MAGMRIGSVNLDYPVLLAPMAGITDLPFRLLCRDLGGVGLAGSELLNCHAIVRKVPKILEKATPHPDDKPLFIQVYGNTEDPLPEAAAWAANLPGHDNAGRRAWLVLPGPHGSRARCVRQQHNALVAAPGIRLDRMATAAQRHPMGIEHIKKSLG